MRRHPKAAPVGPTSTPRQKRGLLALAATIALAIAALVGVSAASADTTPSVSIAAPSAVSYTSAHLSGTVNPNGGPSTTEWRFEYSTTGEEGSWSWGPSGELSGPEAEGTSPVTVEGDLTGLAPGGFYFLRLVASNEFGNNRAVAQTFLFTESIASPSVSIDPPAAITSSGAHFEGEINPGGSDPAFTLDWRFDCTPACPGLEGSLPAGTSPQTVEAEATNLLPGTAYKVSLVAKNAGEPISAGPESFTTDPIAPQVEGQSASPSATEATLGAHLHPGGAKTTYFFQYGPTAAYGQSTAPKVITGAEAKAVSDSISGLAPGTTYHYRLLAENSEGSAEGADRTFTTLAQGQGKGSCPNEAFRTGSSAHLPDCRAYEMVSPVFKNGTDVGGLTRANSSPPVRSSVSGDRAVFVSEASFAGNGSSFLYSSYLSGRSAQGWDSRGLGLPAEYMPVREASSHSIRAFSRDLRYSVVLKADPPLTSDTTPNTLNLFRRDNFDGSVVKLTPVGLMRSESSNNTPNFAGASEDFSHILFESKLAMTQGAVSEKPNLYEWADGQVRLVGVLPNGEPAGEGSFAGGFSLIPGQSGGSFGNVYLETAISEDGSRIVWTDAATKQLYVSVGGTTTAHVSKSQRTNDSGPGGMDPSGSQPALWHYSTPDGSTVYFTSPEKLTNDSTASTTPGMKPVLGSPDLYAYHVDSGELEDLSVSPEPGMPADVQGMLGASDDGEYVYFVAGGVLAPGAEAGFEKANLYLWHAGEIEYIATLGDGLTESPESANWQNNAYAKIKPSRVTGDGQVAIFRSKQQLTDYDNAGSYQIYRYDAGTEELTCVSCNPRSAASTADATLSAPTVSGPPYAEVLERTLSADGSRVYFNTPESLVPQDTNGQIDVYQWENGEVSLISSGQGSTASYFAEASASGDDVFFVTRERLSPTDIDDNADLYDARVNGGFALAAVGGTCQGEDCQPAGSSPPLATTPGSGAVAGQGNAKPRRDKQACAKPRKGKKARASATKKRCVKKQAAKKKRAAAKKQGGGK